MLSTASITCCWNLLRLPPFQHHFLNNFQLFVLCIHHFWTKRQGLRIFLVFTVIWRQENDGETRKLFIFLLLKVSYKLSAEFLGPRYINKKFSKALGLQTSSEVWTSTLRRTESEAMTFQAINVTTKSRRNRGKPVWADEKSTTQEVWTQTLHRKKNEGSQKQRTGGRLLLRVSGTINQFVLFCS